MPHRQNGDIVQQSRHLFQWRRTNRRKCRKIVKGTDIFDNCRPPRALYLCTRTKSIVMNTKKFAIALLMLLSVSANVSGQQAALPGMPQTEAYVMTPVDTTSGVTVRKVAFLRSNNIVLVGNLFLPARFDATRRYPAILSVHPAGSVKEQSAGLYAYLLAERGFVTLAFDAAYAGESGGTPHWQEAPYERVEDIRYAVDYLVTLPFVDEEHIGALGLCAGGGYVMATAPTERRIRAVAGVSAADIGAANRESWLRGRSIDEQIQLLEDVCRQRTREARGAALMKVYMCPEPTVETAPSFREGYDYYRTARAWHPRADNFYLRRSQATKMAFSAIENIRLLTQPALLIAGSEADSDWQTERLFNALPGKDKKVVTIEGASHIDLYDKPRFVTPAVDHLSAFFARTLASVGQPEQTARNQPIPPTVTLKQ